MKIATLNIDWANKTQGIKTKIENLLNGLNADIMVLTEAIEINLHPKYNVARTINLPKAVYEDVDYKLLLKGKTGYRTIIYSKYPIVRTLEVADALTSVAIEVLTEYGLITVYGTILGTRVVANKFIEKEMTNLLKDIDNLLPIYKHYALIGDLNTAFLNKESQYQVKAIKSREVLLELFEKQNLTNITEAIPLNIDHIVLSKSIFDSVVSKGIFVLKNEVSDHQGIYVALKDKNFS